MLKRSTVCAALALLMIAACATASQKRDARLRRELDAYEFEKPIAEVWPAALELVHERGFALVGRDREAIGQEEQGVIGKLFARGYDTRVAGGQWVAETDANPQQVRYRIAGTGLGAATCRIQFFAVQGNDYGGPEPESRDVQLELALVRKLDPGAAAALEQAAGQD